MRRALVLVMAVVLFVVGVGCGDDDEVVPDAAPQPDAPPAQPDAALPDAGPPSACATFLGCFGGCAPADMLCPSACLGATPAQGQDDFVGYFECVQTLCAADCDGTDPTACDACLIAQCPGPAHGCLGLGNPGGGTMVPDPISTACTAANPLPAGCVATAPPSTVWAATVESFSSEFGDTYWAADRTLGAPDVYPCYGDLPDAWSTAGADVAGESIVVSFGPTPVTASAVLIVEVFSRSAIDSMEISSNGTTFTPLLMGTPAAEQAAACIHRFDLALPSTPFRYLRVNLASETVPTWNLIDAIGIVP